MPPLMPPKLPHVTPAENPPRVLAAVVAAFIAPSLVTLAKRDASHCATGFACAPHVASHDAPPRAHSHPVNAPLTVWAQSTAAASNAIVPKWGGDQEQLTSSSELDLKSRFQNFYCISDWKSHSNVAVPIQF